MAGSWMRLKFLVINSLTKKEWKNWLLKFVKWLFLVAVSIFLITHLPDLISSMAMLSPWSVISVLVLQLLTLLLVAYQWHLCSKVFEHRSPGSMKDFWIINSYGTLLEGVTPAAKTGGEGLKAVMIVRKLQYTKEEAVLLVACHKLLSISSFFVVMGVFYFGLFLSVPDFMTEGPVLITAASAAVFLAVVIFIFKNLKRKLEKIYPDSKLVTTIEKIIYVLKLFYKHKLLVSSAFGVGLMIWFLLGIKSYLISIDMEAGLSLFQVSTAAFVGYLFGMIPVSPGGLGTFEGAMMVQLVRMGMTRGPALSLSLLSRLGTFWFTLLISFISVSLVQLASGKPKWWQMNKNQ